MSILKFLFKQYIIAFVGIGIILGGCSGKIGNPDISITQAQKLFSEGQANIDKKQAYLKYKTACYEGNHYPSCIEAKKILDSNSSIDKEESPTNYTIQKVKIFQYLCDKDDLDGCQKLLKSWGDEYDLAFPSKRQNIGWGVDFPLVFLTAGIYIMAFFIKNGTFVKRYDRDRDKIPDDLKEKIQKIATTQCNANDAQACLVIGNLKKSCELGNAKACIQTEKYQEACDLGNLEGCITLAENSSKGDFSKFSTPREELCKKGDAKACLELAKVAEARKKNDQAKTLSNKACQLGLYEGCHFYANLQLKSNPKESLIVLEKMCKQGEEQACEKILEIAQKNKNTDNNLAKMFSKRSCDLGNVSGCSLYADLNMETNFNEAIKPLKKMCEEKNLSACKKMADIFLERDTKTDKLEAIKYLKNALAIQSDSVTERKLEKAQNQIEKIDTFQNAKQGCSKGDQEACFQLADFYSRGEKGVVNQDKEKALELYANLCIKNKNAEFCKTAGDRYKQERKYALANNFYIKSIVLTNKNLDTSKLDPTSFDFGDRLMSCNISLNVSIEHRRGFDSDARCYSKLCKDGYLYGCTMTHILGKEFLQDKNYSRKYPVRQDYFKAKEIFEENCKNGYGLSCIYLSGMFFNGKGVKTDKVKAKELRDEGIRLLTKSCSFENGSDCTYLANEALDTNPKKAFELYTKGCELGVSFACVQVGKMYEKGIGTTKNMNKAKDFYGQACDFQDQEGCSNYNRLSQ